MAAKLQYQGTGRRKNAIARVRLIPGEGKLRSIKEILLSTSVRRHWK